ncbi:unnamed protein product [Microthlaspi erraticum]|nr:unnamed protein product [Microthlaspi erraticum]
MMREHGCSKSRAEIEAEAEELCSLWEAQIGDVQWHPFKILESDGPPKRIVVKDDEKVLKLKYDYGERVCDEVVRAKEEIEDHNASGSFVTLEL